MFILPRNTELTIPLLQEFIEEHKREVASRFKKLKAAYESDHDILHAPAKPKHKPDNRVVVNFVKYIVDTLNGYFIGNPIKTVADDMAVSDYVEHLDQYNDQDDNNAELSKLCDLYGRGFEVYYTDEESELCITYMSPLEAFMIYDDSIVERPMYFVRLYSDRDGNEYGEVSDSYGRKRFVLTGGLRYTDDEWQPHNFKDVPATEYIENAERQGIAEPILSIQNAYNKAVSEAANDVDYFADAYLKILGALVESEDIAFIRDTRVLNFTGEDAHKIVAEFMDKPSNDTAKENLLNRLERLIFNISMVANISDENFGASSGIALRYKLQAMSNLEKTKERKFASGMNRRYRVLFAHPASKVQADAWMQLQYQFTPNIPANLLEETQIAQGMEGIVSHETQLKVLSIVDNVQDELDRIEEENEMPEMTAVESTMFGNEPAPVVGEEDAEGLNDEQPGLLE